MTTTSVSAPRSCQSSVSRVRAPATSDPSGQALTGVRLTRRGRLLVVFLVLIAAFAVFSMMSGPAASTDTPHQGSYRTVVVQPGETLWDIAGDVAPNEDRRAVITQILDLNSMTDAGSLRVGQPLAVPAS